MTDDEKPGWRRRVRQARLGLGEEAAGETEAEALAGGAATAADIIRVREALRMVMGFSGLTRREVERRLAARGKGFNLTRLLAGEYEIKLRHVLHILSVLDIDPRSFVAMVLSKPQRGNAVLQRMAAVLVPEQALLANRRAPTPVRALLPEHVRAVAEYLELPDEVCGPFLAEVRLLRAVLRDAPRRDANAQVSQE